MDRISSSTASEQVILGRKKMKEFLGEELVNKLGSTLRDDIFTRTSSEYISEVCFSSYARPALSFKERSLMNLAMLVALNRGPELRIHVRAAINNGLTEEQICEVCRHTMIYCGVPAGRDAFLTASSVIAEMKEAGELPKTA